MQNTLEVKIKTLTPLWLGGIDREPARLHETGLIGSLRWWYEVVVRGLGGRACDPTSTERCPEERGPHCPVCELFGCTGWARKFRLQVLDEHDRLRQAPIEQNQTLKLRFIPLRPVLDEEWMLMRLTLAVVAGYGAIGGKTVLKPSKEEGRAREAHHLDFGLIELADPLGADVSREKVRQYLSSTDWRKVSHGEFAWASLQHFWCAKGRCLKREDRVTSSFNRVVGRKESKGEKDRVPEERRDTVSRWSESMERKDQASDWLAGGRRRSKKVFSFAVGAGRTFGFVKPGLLDFDQMKERLRWAWPDLEDGEFITGNQILDNLLSGGDTP